MKSEKCSQANELGYVVKSVTNKYLIPALCHTCRSELQFALQQESQFALQQESQFTLSQESQFALSQESQFAFPTT